MAARTRKYKSMARTKKNTIVSMGEDAAWIEIGQMALMLGLRCGASVGSGSHGRKA